MSTKLNITRSPEENPPGSDGTYAHRGSRGGTEMIAEEIRNRVRPALLERFMIIHSRVRDWMFKDLNGRIPILVMHDTWDDPENQWMRDEKLRKRFARIIFVSHHQQATFNIGLGVPYHEGVVIQNAIVPIPAHKKPIDCVNMIYHTTPHRGLEILVPVFEKIHKEMLANVHLDVFSSFNAYNWPTRDEPYKALFERCRVHPAITYHGFQPNEIIREALQRSHIYAYPCIWPETSCISVIEAMSAGCRVVTSSLAALPETCAGMASMYTFSENPNTSASRFCFSLAEAIQQIGRAELVGHLEIQKMIFDTAYSWEARTNQWEGLLHALIREKDAA